MAMGRLRQLWDCLSTWFIDFHFKNWGKIDKNLIVFRTLSIIGLFAYCIIDTLMYYSKSTEKSDRLKFIHGSQYIAIEILVIIYASGVAAFGISVEIYILMPYCIVNGVLVARTCGGSDEATNGIIWAMKIFFLFLAVELCHRSFRKLRQYNEHFNSSARAMLKQALFFSVTMLFLNAPGLRPVYRATIVNLPHLCAYETRHCGIVDLYEPLFGYDDDSCFDDLSSYAAGRGQLRIFRDFILLNIVSYSVFNRNFLKIRSDAKYLPLRILLVLLFTALATSALVSYIDPLVFIHKCLLAYNIIECIIFVIILGLLAFNLYHLRDRQPCAKQQSISCVSVSLEEVRIVIHPTTLSPKHEEMEIIDRSPTILPSS